MASETWSKEHCPKCNNGNWICHGDVDDCTIEDIDAIACFNCKHVFWLSEEDAKDIYFDQYNKDEYDENPPYKTLEEVLHNIANIKVGRKNPDDPYVSYGEFKED